MEIPSCRLWNTIPNNLRNIDTYRSFKRGLKELDLVGLYRGYYTVARRYEFYVRVARTISHE